MRVPEADAGRAFVRFETTEPLLIPSLSEAGSRSELPITIVDGEVTIEPAAPREKRSELGTLLAKSTASEKLHRAAGTVVTEFVGSDADAGLT